MLKIIQEYKQLIEKLNRYIINLDEFQTLYFDLYLNDKRFSNARICPNTELWKIFDALFHCVEEYVYDDELRDTENLDHEEIKKRIDYYYNQLIIIENLIKENPRNLDDKLKELETEIEEEASIFLKGKYKNSNDSINIPFTDIDFE